MARLVVSKTTDIGSIPVRCAMFKFQISKNMRDRAWRRKKTCSIWNSRCKKFMFEGRIEDGTVVRSVCDQSENKKSHIIIKAWRKPETWKEFKTKDPLAKYLKNSTTSRTYIYDKLEAKHKNKLQRALNKKAINEGIQEYEDLYDETYESWYNEDVNEWQQMYQSGYKVA